MATDAIAATLHPARIFGHSVEPTAAAAIAVGALVAEGFRVRSRPGSTVVALEYGGWWSELLLSIWLGWLPGPIGKHAYAVVIAEHGLLTISLVRGLRSRFLVHRAMAATAVQLQKDGLLLSDSGLLLGDDLSPDSPASPRGFSNAKSALLA